MAKKYIYFLVVAICLCSTFAQANEDKKKSKYDSDCVKHCGAGFTYARPGNKYDGKERVCLKYPKRCGYDCTTGWDIWSPNKPYTCQQAIQE